MSDEGTQPEWHNETAAWWYGKRYDRVESEDDVKGR